MPNDPAFALSSADDTAARKNPKRGARKYGSGERGFHCGSYPHTGPFDIDIRRDKIIAGDREGRAFYLLTHLARKKAPRVGWLPWLASNLGAGTYRIRNFEPMQDQGSGDVVRMPNRGIFYIPPELAARYANAPDDDDDDDAAPTRGARLDMAPPPAQENPAPTTRTLIDQIRELRELEAELRPEAPEPSETGALETLSKSPVVIALLNNWMRAQAGAPKIEPPPPPPPDPYAAALAAYARRHNLTAEQACEALDAAAHVAQIRAQQAQTEHANDGDDDDADAEPADDGDDDAPDGDGFNFGG